MDIFRPGIFFNKFSIHNLWSNLVWVNLIHLASSSTLTIPSASASILIGRLKILHLIMNKPPVYNHPKSSLAFFGSKFVKLMCLLLPEECLMIVVMVQVIVMLNIFEFGKYPITELTTSFPESGFPWRTLSCSFSCSSVGPH